MTECCNKLIRCKRRLFPAQEPSHFRHLRTASCRSIFCVSTTNNNNGTTTALDTISEVRRDSGGLGCRRCCPGIGCPDTNHSDWFFLVTTCDTHFEVRSDCAARTCRPDPGCEVSSDCTVRACRPDPFFPKFWFPRPTFQGSAGFVSLPTALAAAKRQGAPFSRLVFFFP